MTYELGRAKFIIDFSSDQALRDQSEYYHDTTVQAQNLTKALAKELKVRESDVKNSASVLISEDKKRVAEQAKIAKATADDQKKTTQELLKVNQAAYKEDLRNWKETLKERDRANKEAAEERKKTTQELLRINQAAYKEEERARKEAEKQSAQRGVFGTGVSAARLGGTASTLLGFGAIGSAALIVHEAITGLTEATLKQEQAQRSLNAAFGATSILYKENAAEIAKRFNLITSEVEQASVSLGVLQSQTNLTGEQIRKLTVLAVDNAAAFGGDLKEAHRSAAGLVLGETEAYEKYGVVLQDDVLKASDLLTESERRRFTTMSESEKQMIRYRLITEHWSEIQGAGTQRVNEAQGGFDKLNKAVNDVATSMGGPLVKVASNTAGWLADLIKQMDDFVEHARLMSKAREELSKEREAKAGGPIPFESLWGGPTKEELEAQARIIKEREDQEKNGFKNRMARIAEAEKDEAKARNKQRAEEEADAKRKQEILEIQLRAAHDAENRRIDDLKRAAEEQKAIELEALDDAKNAELQKLEDVENARKAAHVLEVARIKKETDDAIKASEDRKRAELERIESEQKAVKAAAEEQIRQLNITADRLKKASEDRRDTELERLETEKEARDRARTEEDRVISDATTKAERALDDAHTRTLRRIEREGEALHKKNQRALRDIENQEKKEEDRHRRVLERIDEETNASLKEIDLQIRGIEEVQRARENARRSSELNRKLGDAQLELRKATGTQDPVASAAAQAKLTAAIRVGDPTAIKKAQDELVEIVGHGDEAIEKAHRELSDVQEDLRDNDLSSAEDAQKQKLQDEQTRITDTADEEKKLEDTRNRQRKERLDNDKNSEKRRLDDSLAALERRKEKEEDSNKDAKRRLDDLVLYNRRKLEDKRQDEDQANKDAVEATQRRYETEQDEIQETYFGEDHGYIPAIKRALDASNESYDGMREAAETRYRTERSEIETTNTAALAALAKQETEQANTYTRLVNNTRLKYEEMRQAVEEKYRAKDGKSGILDQYDEMKRVSQIQLDAVMQQFRLHKLGLTGEDGIITLQWAEAQAAAKAYFDYLIEQENAQRARAEADAATRKRRQTLPNTGAHGPRDPGTDYPDEPNAPPPPPQLGPIYGPPGSGAPIEVPGGGPAPANPPVVTPTPAPGHAGVDSGEVNVSPDRFSTSFGFLAPYGAIQFNARIPNHRGIDLVVKGAARGGQGLPAGAFREGTVTAVTIDSNGGNGVTIRASDGLYDRYFHFDEINVSHGQHVKRGQRIGIIGESGTVGKPHLHYEVSRNGSVGDYEDQGQPLIDPRPYMNGRDAGYTFNNPTMYHDIFTGERGVLAERGPEMLLGRQATRTAQRMGISATARPNVPSMDYMSVGARLAHPGLTNGATNNLNGDTMNYYGVAPEDVMKRWRADQRRQRVLRGVR